MHRVWRRVQYWGSACLPALWVALWLPDRSGEGKNGGLACRWLDVEGVARGRLATTTPTASHIPFKSTARWCSRGGGGGGLIEEIKKVELIGPRREIWREGVSALACTVGLARLKTAPPHLQQGSHRVHRVRRVHWAISSC